MNKSERQSSSCEASVGVFAIGAAITAGAAIGAAAMYLWDPDRGRARRTRLEQQLESRVKHGARDLTVRASGALQKAKGVVAKACSMPACDVAVDDSIVADRVRSRLGHLTRHPKDIETNVRDGVVSLCGTATERERKRFAAVLPKIPGVRVLRDLLHSTTIN